MAKKTPTTHKNGIPQDLTESKTPVSKHCPKRTPAQRLHDLEIIAELTLQHVKQTVIAQQLNLSQQTISRDLQEVKKRWLQKADVSFDEHVAHEIAKLEILEREYWAGWKRSQQPRKNSLVTVREKTDATPGENEAREGMRDGNPRFLEGVLFVMERKARLLGLDKPTRINGTIQTFDLTKLSDEQLERIANGENIESVIGYDQNAAHADSGGSRERAPAKAARRRAQNAPRRSK
jgi:hypothetical protein